MQLIQNPPPAPSIEQLALMRMQSLANRAMDTLEQSTRATFDGAWKNTKSTPEKMLAEMGTKAKAAFVAHYYAVQALKAYGRDTSAYDTPPLPYTTHQDGTITLD